MCLIFVCSFFFFLLFFFNHCAPLSHITALQSPWPFQEHRHVAFAVISHIELPNALTVEAVLAAMSLLSLPACLLSPGATGALSAVHTKKKNPSAVIEEATLMWHASAQKGLRACTHTYKMCMTVYTRAQTYCINAHRLEFIHMQLSTWMHTHTHTDHIALW